MVASFKKYRIRTDGRFVKRPYNQILHQINTTMKFSLRIGVSMQFEFLPVGVGALDDPESNKFCFLNGY